MGRIKTTPIKKNAIKLFNQYRDVFQKDFEKNKELVEEFVEIRSKKTRNVMAGYITKLVKQHE